jgi:uncharacterized protein YodC (DUF2158 family)
MVDQQFKVGVEVQLKSGSPTMVIDHILNDRATCVWFDGTKQCQGVFALATLRHATGDDDPNTPAVGTARMHRG